MSMEEFNWAYATLQQEVEESSDIASTFAESCCDSLEGLFRLLSCRVWRQLPL